MYVENKSGAIDGVAARIGWVTFSKTGQSVYYRGRTLAKANGISGNFIDVETRDEYWVSGIKKRGSNVHWAESVEVKIDDDAVEEYRKLRSGRNQSPRGLGRGRHHRLRLLDEREELCGRHWLAKEVALAAVDAKLS